MFAVLLFLVHPGAAAAPFQGLTLQAARCEFVVGSLPRPGPTCQATDGMLRSMTSEDFSAELMKCQPQVVQTYILDYVEVPGRPDQLQVQGITKDVSPSIVSSMCDDKVEPAKKNKK